MKQSIAKFASAEILGLDQTVGGKGYKCKSKKSKKSRKSGGSRKSRKSGGGGCCYSW